jgi:hypothetical protein
LKQEFTKYYFYITIYSHKKLFFSKLICKQAHSPFCSKRKVNVDILSQRSFAFFTKKKRCLLNHRQKRTVNVHSQCVDQVASSCDRWRWIEKSSEVQCVLNNSSYLWWLICDSVRAFLRVSIFLCSLRLIQTLWKCSLPAQGGFLVFRNTMFHWALTNRNSAMFHIWVLETSVSYLRHWTHFLQGVNK